MGNVSVGQLQKIQIGNKIQYVRVIPSGGNKAAPQTTTVRQTQPILPSTTKGGSSTSSQVSLKAIPSTGNQQVVKIALPSNFQQQGGVSINISKNVYHLTTIDVLLIRYKSLNILKLNLVIHLPADNNKNVFRKYITDQNDSSRTKAYSSSKLNW